jgi:NAD(P)-dependent dehydrogenase (short-subunit alcohol dehydrogenase family)
MNESLDRRAIIITGAASGIGRACATALAAAGARLTLVDLRDDGFAALRDELAAAGTDVASDVLTLTGSIRDEADMNRMAAESLERFGRIDALVACAGLLRVGEKLKTVADTSLEDWNTIVETNLTGTFLSNRAVLPAMMEQREGDIINISSTSGLKGRPFDGAYCASKFGIIGLSESLSEELGRFGIRVQTVLPDAVATPLWDQNGHGALKPAQTMPPERIAELVAWLLALPRDTYLMNPVIAPMKTRSKKRKG